MKVSNLKSEISVDLIHFSVREWIAILEENREKVRINLLLANAATVLGN